MWMRNWWRLPVTGSRRYKALSPCTWSSETVVSLLGVPATSCERKNCVAQASMRLRRVSGSAKSTR